MCTSKSPALLSTSNGSYRQIWTTSGPVPSAILSYKAAVLLKGPNPLEECIMVLKICVTLLTVVDREKWR